MEKKNIISLAGLLASGKGEVSRILMERLGYGIYRNGEYARGLAKEMGMDINEFNEYLKGHPEIDRDIEASASKYAKDHDNFIIDARLGWYAVPESFKVFLTVDIDVAASRAFNDKNRKDSENYSSIEEQKEALIERRKIETERYMSVYGINQDDMNNYDLVIDTSNISPNEVADMIINKYEEWKNK